MAGVSDYITIIKNRIANITIINGYGYDIGTIDGADAALIEYPAVDISYGDEAILSEPLITFGISEIELIIKIRYLLVSIADRPIYEVQQYLDTVLNDIRGLFILSDAGIYVGTKAAFFSFRRSERSNAKSKSVNTPVELISYWSLKYQQ